MDEKKLKDILENMDGPEADENAKKRAVNLAVSEFEAHQQEKVKKNEKNFQGFGWWARLMGNSNSKQRTNPMEQKNKKNIMYGGMATAMAVVLIAGISLTQMEDFTSDYQSSNVSVVSGADTVDPTFAPADEPVNQRRIEEAIRSGTSALPTPTQAPTSQRDYFSGGDDAVSGKNAVSDNQEARSRQESKARRNVSKPQALAEQAAPRPYNPGQSANEAMSLETDQSFAATKPAPSLAPNLAPTAKIMERRALTAQEPTLGGVVAPQTLSIMPVTPDVMPPQGYKEIGRDQFEDFKVNPVKIVDAEPVSTFSVDVDTASYSFVRRQLNSGVLPQKDAVRVEELINYFDYDYKVPADVTKPFEPNVTITESPWAEGKKLLHIGIKGYEITGEKPRSNIVFLLDVSGSMNSADKLPLVKNSMKLLLDTLDPDDTIAIAVYAGAAGTVLEPTKVSEKSKIIAAMNRLSAGGSTAGAEGINLAYQLAEQNFDEKAINRVILATDGDFNVGITNREELKDYVERKRNKGIFLSVLGFGQGNYNDHMMQTLAQNGNGVAAYIDSLNEARKVLVDEASSTLFPIAKDVKIQVEFNPKTVAEYRLIGYETRALNREDFNNDKVDAGDIGAGHTVTAIYEITPVGSENASVDPLRYGGEHKAAEQHTAKADFSGEYAFLKMRYKLPKEDTSKLITTPVTNDVEALIDMSGCGPLDFCLAQASDDVRFSTAVAAFGQLLKGGQYTGKYTYDDVIALASGAKGQDPFGYRAEFINLVRLAKSASVLQPR